jgi:hypothetical protein
VTPLLFSHSVGTTIVVGEIFDTVRIRLLPHAIPLCHMSKIGREMFLAKQHYVGGPARDGPQWALDTSNVA